MSANLSASKQFLFQLKIRRGYLFGAIIITALVAFEIFNYSTTEYALSDLLGNLTFAGIRWATILSIAFCGIDFAGIARLFTPQAAPGRSPGSHIDTWYLFGAWMLAASMNAMLTWWEVSLAIIGHETLGNAVVEREMLVRIVPIFVALMVWLIRVLIIGTFSVSGNRLFSQEDMRLSNPARTASRPAAVQPTFTSRPPQAVRTSSQAVVAHRPGFKSNSAQIEAGFSGRPEPTYHPLAAGSSQNGSARTDPGRINTSIQS